MYVNIDDKQYQAKGGKMTVVGYCRLSRDEDKIFKFKVTLHINDS